MNQYKLSNGYNIESTCEMAIYTYGRKHQQIKAIEELGELIQALTNSVVGADHNVEEESADVEIMIFQLKKFFKTKDQKRETKRPMGISLIIKDLSYLVTELSREYNGQDHHVTHAIYKVDEALHHIRKIYHVDCIEKYKYEKLERLSTNLLKCRTHWRE
ncbi:hypothetical protein [Clostridium botulinum]|uniref:hypothetical protein n=1 Tax=Clostridium botulinum TaxID=1491 RepID=UPI0013FE7265|nr:hypothetical protein [Clostridium botulinum]MBY6918148.1 hypothetical protein [Clostridium botulinum]NFQ39409.1 hypothetical protein [Clostridium botulinum]